ncbi:hypothetical protein [Microbacterium sp. Leaf203]|uniref:DUF3846 domain-containing protein n=1 Tax=Microbacterium sp. Leaf203 TaxID=1735677 RepID=UPI0006F851A6|nr:hypothetical protein [Microbacterium sp. Leaf203]KQM36819.1 hypothetical protein ASE56_10415 [Microbacterium sp. Leaf203]
MTIEALRIRPHSDSFDAVTLEHKPVTDTHLQALYAALDVQLADVIRLPEKTDMRVNDQRRIGGSGPNRIATNMLRACGIHLADEDDVCGAVLFAGTDGNGAMASLTDRQRAVLEDALAQAVSM